MAPLGAKIGEGMCAEIFEWENGQVVKLARPNTHPAALKKEWRHSRLVWEHGLPAPEIYGLVEAEGRTGFVMERLEGITLMQRLMAPLFRMSESLEPDDEGIRLMARVLSGINRISGVPLEGDQRADWTDRIRGTSYLEEEEKEALVDLLNRQPRKEQLCHGDPNPFNFMIQPDGRIVVIDWMNASVGNPESDWAEFVVLLRYGTPPPETPEPFRLAFDGLRERTIGIFTEEYMRQTGLTMESLEPWVPLAAAVKLSTDSLIHEQKQVLADHIRRLLSLSRTNEAV